MLTVALTQPMSNQAAALVVLPIAMQTGLQLGVDPRAFGMMVAVAASCSYLTPLEPSCLMVYGPGKYQFSDFFKVGMPLTVLIYAIRDRAGAVDLADVSSGETVIPVFVTRIAGLDTHASAIRLLADIQLGLLSE